MEIDYSLLYQPQCHYNPTRLFSCELSENLSKGNWIPLITVRYSTFPSPSLGTVGVGVEGKGRGETHV